MKQARKAMMKDRKSEIAQRAIRELDRKFRALDTCFQFMFLEAVHNDY